MLLGKENPCVAGVTATKHLLPTHPLWLVACFRAVISCQTSFHRDFVQTDILDRGPNDGEATGLRREHVDLISSLLPRVILVAEALVEATDGARTGRATPLRV